MQSARPRLGQLLVEANILTPDQLEAVLVQQRNDPRKKLGQLLVESGLVSETRITQILSQQLSVPWVSLYHIDFSRELLARVPELAVSTGSACHSEVESISPTLAAMGVPTELARGTIRLSVGWYTTEDEVERAASALLGAWEGIKE